MLPTPQGYDVECCRVKVSVYLCRHLGVQFDSVAQIPCALHLLLTYPPHMCATPLIYLPTSHVRYTSAVGK
jgi:hypothetical protein